MIDIIPHVANLLEPLGAQIELEYRNTEVTFPLIVLSTVSDVALTNDCVEYWTRLMIQIDAYTLDKYDTKILAEQIDSIMTANGFMRQNEFPVTEGDLERRQMSYSCNIDFSHTRIITT